MIKTVYLDGSTADLLRCYGTIEEVINKIVDAYMNGVLDIEQMDNAPPRLDANKYTIDITNEDYEILSYSYSEKSKHISIRRMIYTFVNNDMFNVLGWQQVNKYVSSKNNIVNKKLNVVLNELISLKRLVSSPIDNELMQIKNLINDIRGKL